MPTRDDKGRFISDRSPQLVEPAVAASNPAIGRGGRQTLDTSDQLGFNAPWVLLPPPNAQGSWDIGKIDDIAFGRYSAEKIVSLLIDLSPDASRGLWDYLRLTNPDWTCKATLLGGKGEPHPQAQKALDAYFETLADIYGTPDLVWTRLFAGMFLRGAYFGELVLDEAGRMPIDFGTPDPMTARYYRLPDPVRGTKWQLAQMQAGKIQILDRPTVRYVPIDPVPGSPYGRSIIAPALFSAVFLLLILHDLRRVVAQQGWPRLDVTVDVQKLKDQIPLDKRNDPKALKQWTRDTIADVERGIAALQPDDTYVHTEAIVMNRPVGAVDSSSLGAIDPLIRGLERMISRGIKSMPFLMGLSESSTESQALRQFESFSQSIRSQQRLHSWTTARLLKQGLQAQGIQADVLFEFGEVRGSEEQRDAQTFMLRLANAKSAYYQGFWSQDQAAAYATDSPSDQSEPRLIESTEQPFAAVGALDGAVSDGAAVNPDKPRSTNVRKQRGAGSRASDSGELTKEEQEGTVKSFDELFPDYAGLLEAEVVG